MSLPSFSMILSVKRPDNPPTAAAMTSFRPVGSGGRVEESGENCHKAHDAHDRGSDRAGGVPPLPALISMNESSANPANATERAAMAA
jgi:hypothetical protein